MVEVARKYLGRRMAATDQYGTLKYPGFDEKRRQGQALTKKINECTDPTEKLKLENELSQLYFDHYTLPVQRDWPLHNWPYKGPMPVDTGPPKSHFIKCRGRPIQEYGWLDRSYAIEKYARMHETANRHMKWTPRAVFQAFLAVGLIPYGLYRLMIYERGERNRRGGRMHQVFK